MGNKNYNKISKKSDKQIEVKEIDEVVETPEVNTEEDTEPKVVMCVVSGCERLNIRENPSLSAKVVRVVEAGSEVCMFPEYAPNDSAWSSVVIDTIDGYCMSKYLTEKK